MDLVNQSEGNANTVEADERMPAAAAGAVCPVDEPPSSAVGVLWQKQM